MKSLYLKSCNACVRYYALPGEGPAWVYLPGLLIPALANFLSVVAHPALRDHRTLLVDYLGSGLSDHPTAFGHRMEDHAESVAAILEHEGIRDCTLIGHSMGGTVGILLALQNPHLVARLIVSEANLSPGGGSATRRIAASSREDYVGRVFPESLASWREAAAAGDAQAARSNGWWGQVDPAALHAASVSLVQLDPNLKARYFRLPIPRTFMYGEHSLPERTGAVRADAPDPRELEANGIDVRIVPGAGHNQMLDNLDGFVGMLRYATSQ